MDDYYVTAPPGLSAVAPVDILVAAPASSSRRSVQIGVTGVAILVVVVVAIELAMRLLGGTAPPPMHQLVTPAPASEGWGPEFVDSLGRPARINPCVPMAYVVNLTGAPPGALPIVQAAVATLVAASGLRLTYRGQTADRPSHSGDQSRLLIGWTGAGETIDEGADTSASTYTRARPTSHGPVILGADIVINSQRTFAEGGAATHESLRLVLLHELGHAVGLRHVDDSSQVMSAVGHLWLSEYGNGDRLGLRVLGAGGCLPSE